jgi:tRNA threonylcarbamoyladenosine biosynthesis protein TsaB
VAQGLALGSSKPVLPIDTLLAVAEDARSGRTEPQRTWAIMDARMNEIYAAQYQFADGRWSTIDKPTLTTPALLNERWQAQAPMWIAGNALTAFAGQLSTRDAQCVPEALPRATAMLLLAQALWVQGGAVDAALALPLYLRDKVAQTTVEREAAKAAKEASGAVR